MKWQIMAPPSDFDWNAIATSRFDLAAMASVHERDSPAPSDAVVGQ